MTKVHIARGLAVFILAVSAGCSDTSLDDAAKNGGIPVTQNCDGQNIVVQKGVRRKVAVIVGVDRYMRDEIPELQGAVADARRFRNLLINKFGFDSRNVCLLENETATEGNFEDAVRSVIKEDAEEGDVAVIYFAGHGSYTRDANSDEPDGRDETLLLYDSRTVRTHGLLDDIVHEWVEEISDSGVFLTVVLDACNSGTATRATFLDWPSLKPRFVPPARFEEVEISPEIAHGDSSPGFLAGHVSEATNRVTLAAAADGSSAMEAYGRGVFTDALIASLEQASPGKLSYAQLENRVRPIVGSSGSMQIPEFSGPLERSVFGTVEALPASVWLVEKVGDYIEIAGLPNSYFGEGAQLAVYRADQSRDELKVENAIAKLSIVGVTGLNARATVSWESSDRAIRPGDFVSLIDAGNYSSRISVSLAKGAELDAMPVPTQTALVAMIQGSPEMDNRVRVVTDRSDFRVAQREDRSIEIRSKHAAVNVFEHSDDQLKKVLSALRLHSIQRGILNLNGSGARNLVDQETLAVTIVPSDMQFYSQPKTWCAAEPNKMQPVPLCHSWKIQVKVSPKVNERLHIGALFLSSDGTIIGFPRDGRTVALGPGEEYTFGTPETSYPDEVVQSFGPLGEPDKVVVFGVANGASIQWDALTELAPRSAHSVQRTHGFETILREHIHELDKRAGATPLRHKDTSTRWTRTITELRVVGNIGFTDESAKDPLSCDEENTASKQMSREYTLHDFDIRPYLPDDPSSKLYQLLTYADDLSRRVNGSGVPYKQHTWPKSKSIQENLAMGIDCSRALWLAFGESGVGYNNSSQYMPTADMIDRTGPMADMFERCDSLPLRIGDVLVYRDEQRSVGHTVLVIDPNERIAWGSHGWDGNTVLGLEEATGVQYQKIKGGREWRAWDRSNMKRAACWRHTALSDEWIKGVGQPGQNYVERACR